MFNKPGPQLEHNLRHKATEMVEVLEQKESNEDKIVMVIDRLRHEHTQLTIHRNVIKRLLITAGLPSYEQYIDKLLYKEQEGLL